MEHFTNSEKSYSAIYDKYQQHFSMRVKEGSFYLVLSNGKTFKLMQARADRRCRDNIKFVCIFATENPTETDKYLAGLFGEK